MLSNAEIQQRIIQSQCNTVYHNLLQKYWVSLEKMADIDKLAFHRRLYTMAKRQIIPYGEEFTPRTNQLYVKPIELEPLRLRTIRMLGQDRYDEDDVLSDN